MLALVVATIGAVISACSGDSTFKAPSSGPTGSGSSSSGTTTGDGGGCIGPTCPDACADHEVPGCACNVEGQHLDCGKAEATFPGTGTSPGTVVCGQGFSVCADGVWSACQITGDISIIPNAPPGYYAENLGAGSPCAANPCDPQCLDFMDTPTGVDAGQGLASGDAGVILSGDAGVCTPKSCASQGFFCGQQSDGCGNVIQCGTCTFPETCGGAGTPNVCGVGGTCTNLCLHQTKCSGTGTTSISGTVYMPNGTTPLPNVLVYVPNSVPSPFLPTLSCVTAGNCTAEVTGSPLIATTTAVDGTFTLTNVPSGIDFPVVIQLGRFRRQFTMSAVPACTNAVVPCTSPTACLSRFPRYENETSLFDNIPKMAFVTAQVDALECVWRKVGIASTGAPGLGGTNYGTGEFTPGNTNGRINFYAASFAWGTYITDVGTTTPYDVTLLGSPTQMANYDMILFPCQGGEQYYDPTKAAYAPGQVQLEANIANFVNTGGRVFATHYSYIWLFTNGTKYVSPLSSAINWAVNGAQPTPDPGIGYIDTSFPGGLVLAQWLQVPAVGASPVYAEMQINTLRNDFTAGNAASQVYVSLEACTSTSADPKNCGGCGNVCGTGKVCSNGVCASSCGTGLTACSTTTCANLKTDPNHCGACGTVCANGQTCVSGTCTCPSGTTTCSTMSGNSCAVTATDAQNCGGCGNVCGIGQTCVGGNCTCPSGLTASGSSCVLTTNDPNNCGSPGTKCLAGEVCNSGTCTCAGSTTLCSGACVVTATDERNCGSCGHACGIGETCTGGTCSNSCGSNLTMCSGECTNTTTDAANCGTCGKVCGAGQYCEGGTCTCGQTNFTACSSTVCTELKIDNNNCGTCGKVCTGATPICVAGTCKAASSCTGATTYCSSTSTCTTTATDPNNCGTCGKACTAGQACVAGACVADPYVATNKNTDPYNCGSSGKVCASGTACVAGVCTCVSGTTCSGLCVDETTDPNNCGACAKKCAAGYECISGTCTCEINTALNDPNNCGGCGTKCPGGDTCVSGTCTPACSNTTSDPNNCGGCGIVCAHGQTCNGGVCTCSSSSLCPSVPMQASFNAPLTASASDQCGRVVFSDFHVENATNTQVPFPTECGGGGFSPQEFLLAQALFDLAGCVNIQAPPACVPVTCGFLGLNCGPAGDGCGGTLDCGGCTSPASCGGSGQFGVCGTPLTFSPASFVRDYDASTLCTNGQAPVWRLYSWNSVTAKNSNIAFTIATATTKAGLASATTFPLQWSNPPGIPTGLLAGGAATAHSAGNPLGSPDTEIGSASPDTTLYANKQPQNNFFLRVIATLNPSSDLVTSPVLSSWDMQIDCVDIN